jgi:signal peptidase II
MAAQATATVSMQPTGWPTLAKREWGQQTGRLSSLAERASNPHDGFFSLAKRAWSQHIGCPILAKLGWACSVLRSEAKDSASASRSEESVPAASEPHTRAGWHFPGLLFLISAVIILLDRITKIAIDRTLPLGGAHVVIPKVFRITHVLNTGAAFSLFGDSASPDRVRWLLVSFSLAAAIAIVVVLLRMGRDLKNRINATTIGLALILGGALGNVYDRIKTGAVIDFLEVHIVHYHWPDFNLADSAIVCGGILLVLHSLIAASE